MTTEPLIMVATDLSARCDRAVDRAFLLAQQLGGSVIVTHIVGEGQLSPEKTEHLRELVRDDMGERAGGSRVEVAAGSVPATLARLAGEWDARIIVTGIGRLNEVRDYVLGTAVDSLVRRAPVPVLVVKRRARRPYERILAATDFSPCSANAVESAAAMFPGTRLRVVNAFHPAFEGFLDARDTAAFIGDEARGEMERFIGQLPDDVRGRLETSVEEGEVYGVLERTIRDWQADLLVVGSHGRGGFAHATIGSRAGALLASEPVDILVVRSSG